MRIDIKNHQELSKLLDALGSEFTKAYSHSRFYHDLSEAVSKHAYAMNNSPAFWRFTYRHI